MALQVDYQTPFGVVPDAYCKICSIAFDEDTGAGIDVKLKIYMSQQTKLDGFQPLDTRVVNIPSAAALAATTEGQTAVGLAYTSVKSLDSRFASAVDV